MQVSEKPALFAGPSNETEELAFLLTHRCNAFERATGKYKGDPISKLPYWGDHMHCTFTCEVCGATRNVRTWNEFVDWTAIKIRGRDVRGVCPAEG